MAEETKKKAGRPTKFNQKMAHRLLFLAAKGLTEDEICLAVDISQDTLTKWKSSRVFASALSESKGEIDEQVKRSLLSRALGYRTTHLKNFVVSDGKDAGSHVEQHEEEVVYPPDTVACIFWLKNRRRKEWQDKPDVGSDASIDNSRNLIQIFQTVRIEEQKQIESGVDQMEVLLGSDFVNQVKANGTNGSGPAH